MHNHRIHFYGRPYIPGVVNGTIRHAVTTVSVDSVLVVAHSDIGIITGQPAGIIVIAGAQFSHAMIKLLASGVPTVVVSVDEAKQLGEGAKIMLDGTSGLISNDLEILAAKSDTKPTPHPEERSTTADGVEVELLASVRTESAAQQAVFYHAAGVGLVRSEFLTPENDRLPDVRFYEHAFQGICAAADPLPVTIRLLDVAVDKLPSWMPKQESVGGVLGLQGVRLFELEPVRSVVHAQLAAISELSHQFDLRILIPYLVRYEELRYWAEHIRSRLDKPIPIGAMVETPAGALDIANWFEIADFVAVGCNDLMQCLFAADRDRPELRNYLDPYAPLLYRFFQQLAEAANGHLSYVQLCGLLPQLPGVIIILLGLGYRKFSVDSTMIPFLTSVIKSTTIGRACSLAKQVCRASESCQVVELLGYQFSAQTPFTIVEDFVTN